MAGTLELGISNVLYNSSHSLPVILSVGITAVRIRCSLLSFCLATTIAITFAPGSTPELGPNLTHGPFVTQEGSLL